MSLSFPLPSSPVAEMRSSQQTTPPETFGMFKGNFQAENWQHLTPLGAQNDGGHVFEEAQKTGSNRSLVRKNPKKRKKGKFSVW